MASQHASGSYMSLGSVPSHYEIYLRWAVRADIPHMARVLTDNLMEFEFQDHFCPTRREHPAEFYAFALGRIRMFFVQPAVRFMVAEKLELHADGERSAQIVGFSTWDAQGDSNPVAMEWNKRDASWLRAVESKLVDLELLHHRYLRNTIFDYAAFYRTWNMLHDSYRGHIETLHSNLHLQFLMVDPAWQRGHGIGHKLLQWGIDVADAVGLPIVIESSLMGYPFYLKHGCKLLTHARIDVVKEKAYDMPIVVYEPKGKEGEFVLGDAKA